MNRFIVTYALVFFIAVVPSIKAMSGEEYKKNQVALFQAIEQGDENNVQTILSQFPCLAYAPRVREYKYIKEKLGRRKQTEEANDERTQLRNLVLIVTPHHVVMSAPTPLHWAVACNKAGIIQLLRSCSADPNAVDAYKARTPLAYAIRYKKEMVEPLLAYNALIPQAKDFVQAILQKDVTLVEALAKKSAAHINDVACEQKMQGRGGGIIEEKITPLGLALDTYILGKYSANAIGMNPEMVKVLLERGAEYVTDYSTSVVYNGMRSDDLEQIIAVLLSSKSFRDKINLTFECNSGEHTFLSYLLFSVDASCREIFRGLPPEGVSKLISCIEHLVKCGANPLQQLKGPRNEIRTAWSVLFCNCSPVPEASKQKIAQIFLEYFPDTTQLALRHGEDLTVEGCANKYAQDTFLPLIKQRKLIEHVFPKTHGELLKYFYKKNGSNLSCALSQPLMQDIFKWIRTSREEWRYLCQQSPEHKGELIDQYQKFVGHEESRSHQSQLAEAAAAAAASAPLQPPLAAAAQPKPVQSRPCVSAEKPDKKCQLPVMVAVTKQANAGQMSSDKEKEQEEPQPAVAQVAAESEVPHVEIDTPQAVPVSENAAPLKPATGPSVANVVQQQGRVLLTGTGSGQSADLPSLNQSNNRAGSPSWWWQRIRSLLPNHMPGRALINNVIHRGVSAISSCVSGFKRLIGW